jgi:TonB-dependent SusC/RagA subfamily outer membrane receptor
MKSNLYILIILFLAISAAPLSGQKGGKKITITGNVSDDIKSPVIGAIITIDGKQTNISTNRLGNYKLKVKPSDLKIGVLISTNYVIEEPIAGKTKVDITIPAAAHQQIVSQILDPGDEAINIGYGTVKKRDLLTSVSKIDGNTNKYASYTNIYDMLRGTVPGVQVVGNSIKIQGAGSLMSGTEPLFVVDGTIVNGISNISPVEVRSVEVLKGSSAAIYGSRGANGVILITLRK